MNDFVQDKY